MLANDDTRGRNEKFRDTAPRLTPDHVAAIFALFEDALRQSGVSSRRGLRPIDFEIGSSPRVIWNFDPGRRDRLFAPKPHPKPALTLSCSAAFLGRLLCSREPIELRGDDELLYFGDTNALAALVAAMSPPRSIHDVRFGDKR